MGNAPAKKSERIPIDLSDVQYERLLKYLDTYDEFMNICEAINQTYKQGKQDKCSHGYYWNQLWHCWVCKNVRHKTDYRFFCIVPSNWDYMYLLTPRICVVDGYECFICTPSSLKSNDISNINHLKKLKPIVDKIEAFENKYANSNIRNSTYEEYRPAIQAYIKQYKKDIGDIDGFNKIRQLFEEVKNNESDTPMN